MGKVHVSHSEGERGSVHIKQKDRTQAAPLNILQLNLSTFLPLVRHRWPGSEITFEMFRFVVTPPSLSEHQEIQPSATVYQEPQNEKVREGRDVKSAALAGLCGLTQNWVHSPVSGPDLPGRMLGEAVFLQVPLQRASVNSGLWNHQLWDPSSSP